MRCIVMVCNPPAAHGVHDTQATPGIRERRAAVSDRIGHGDLVLPLAEHRRQMLRRDRAAVSELAEERDGRVRTHLAIAGEDLIHPTIGVDDDIAHMDHEGPINEADEHVAHIIAAHRHAAEAEDHAVFRGRHGVEERVVLARPPEPLRWRPGRMGRQFRPDLPGVLGGARIEIAIARELIGDLFRRHRAI